MQKIRRQAPGAYSHRIDVHVTAAMHAALQTVAIDEDLTMPGAARAMIEAGLAARARRRSRPRRPPAVAASPAAAEPVQSQASDRADAEDLGYALDTVLGAEPEDDRH